MNTGSSRPLALYVSVDEWLTGMEQTRCWSKSVGQDRSICPHGHNCATPCPNDSTTCAPLGDLHANSQNLHNCFPSENGTGPSDNPLAQTITRTLASFDIAPPFTIQRIAELLLFPNRYHVHEGKYLRALDRTLTVPPPRAPPPAASLSRAYPRYLLPRATSRLLTPVRRRRTRRPLKSRYSHQSRGPRHQPATVPRPRHRQEQHIPCQTEFTTRRPLYKIRVQDDQVWVRRGFLRLLIPLILVLFPRRWRGRCRREVPRRAHPKIFIPLRAPVQRTA
jgi:PPP4R2